MTFRYFQKHFSLNLNLWWLRKLKILNQKIWKLIICRFWERCENLFYVDFWLLQWSLKYVYKLSNVLLTCPSPFYFLQHLTCFLKSQVCQHLSRLVSFCTIFGTNMKWTFQSCHSKYPKYLKKFKNLSLKTFVSILGHPIFFKF